VIPSFAKRAARCVAVLISALVFALLCLSPCAEVTAAPASIVVTISPLSDNIETSGSQSFTATVQNDAQNKGVNWTLWGIGCEGVTCGTLSALSSPSGVAITYTAPAALPLWTEVTLTATSAADFRKFASATIAVTSPALAVTVSPEASSVELEQKLTVTATVANNQDNRGVVWRLRGTGCGGRSCGRLSAIFSKSGAPVTYTAPANMPKPAEVTLTATSVADFTKSGAATITVTPAPGAVVATASATSASVPVGASQNFMVTVQNDPQDQGVTWTLLGAGCSEQVCGSLSSSSTASGAAIIYTAPAAKPDPAAITLRATSVTDSTKSVAIVITIM
jgi:hypothetical protein